MSGSSRTCYRRSPTIGCLSECSTRTETSPEAIPTSTSSPSTPTPGWSRTLRFKGSSVSWETWTHHRPTVSRFQTPVSVLREANDPSFSFSFSQASLPPSSSSSLGGKTAVLGFSLSRRSRSSTSSSSSVVFTSTRRSTTRRRTRGSPT